MREGGKQKGIREKVRGGGDNVRGGNEGRGREETM